MDPFVHLQVQSAYSFLWGTFTPEDLVSRVKSLGQTAVALTDLGMQGLIRFITAAQKAGIQPIVGAKVLVENGEWLTLLVKNQGGYGNLCRLLSLSYRNGLTPEEAIDLTDLEQRSQGLLCLAGGWGSRLSFLSESGPNGWAEEWLGCLKSLFPGPDDFFVVLGENPDQPGQSFLVNRLANMMEIQPVASNGVAYLFPDEDRIHQALVAIQRRHHHRLLAAMSGPEHHLMPGDEMARRLPFPQALKNTRRIADICRNFQLPINGCHPPRFRDSRMADRALKKICRESLQNKFSQIPDPYHYRLTKELDLMSGRDLSDYFLLVREVANFARQNNIRFSVRGSASGSLVVHLTLGGIDPLGHGLLFERFINHGRNDLPDVDLDFDSLRRDEVVGYILETYPEQTALVGTVHTMKLRAAVRLAAKGLGYTSCDLKQLTECLPLTTRGLGLPEALDSLPELKFSRLKKHPFLVTMAECLRRLPFQPSVHLGGVLITPGHIQDWTATSRSPKGYAVAHLDKDDIEALGLLKLDILGLRMHSAIRKTAEILAGQGIEFDPDHIPPDDKKTYDLLGSTNTLGVFQIESPGQRQLLGRLQPRCFSDLIAEISLFRPGPVEGNLVNPFVQRKSGLENPVFLDPDLEPILNETYGLILFQEQVLSIVHVFAGLDYAEADQFRRVMTKDRGKRQMEILKERFIRGAMESGREHALAEEVWRQVMTLAAYGFCKAHAASFAQVTYQSAYLKAHHPLAFFLGLLNAGQVGTYPPAVILNEARRQGVPVLPPHVNKSGGAYLAEGQAIRVPLVVIKGLGRAFARRIVSERERSGEYVSRDAFRFRVPLPDPVFSQLAQTGALDGLDSSSGWLFKDMAYA